MLVESCLAWIRTMTKRSRVFSDGDLYYSQVFRYYSLPIHLNKGLPDKFKEYVGKVANGSELKK
jgi:hypothetical protein